MEGSPEDKTGRAHQENNHFWRYVEIKQELRRKRQWSKEQCEGGDDSHDRLDSEPLVIGTVPGTAQP